MTATARQAQIVAATVNVIADVGYGKTSFARIAERAGLSSPRLISYQTWPWAQQLATCLLTALALPPPTQC